jgi:hypothetical protein
MAYTLDKAVAFTGAGTANKNYPSVGHPEAIKFYMIMDAFRLLVYTL